MAVGVVMDTIGYFAEIEVGYSICDESSLIRIFNTLTVREPQTYLIHHEHLVDLNEKL